MNVGAVSCNITTVSDTQIVCNLNSGSAGAKPVVVNVAGQGNSNRNVNYTFNLEIASISNNQGEKILEII